MTKEAIMVLVMLILVGGVSALDYCVSQNGDRDCGDVTNRMNIGTFNGLTGTGYAGDIFYFSGTFSTRVTPKISGTLSGGNVVLDGLESGNCLIVGIEDDSTICTSSAQLQMGMDIGDSSYSPDYLTIQDFRMTFSGGNSPPISINGWESGGYCEHIQVQRNLFYDGPGVVAGFRQMRYYIIKQNKFHGFGTEAISTSKGINFIDTFYGIVSENDFDGEEGTYGSPGCDTGSGDVSCNVIEGHGIENTIFEYNDIHDCAEQAGITFKEGYGGNKDIIFRFNKVHDNHGNGVGWGGDNNTPARNLYLYGNLIYGNGITTTSGGACCRGLETDINSANATIWANVFNNNAKYAWSGYFCNADNCGRNHRFLFNTVVRNGDRGPDPFSLGRGGINSGHQDGNIEVIGNIFWYNRPLRGGGSQYNQVKFMNIIEEDYDYNTYYHPDSPNNDNTDFWVYNTIRQNKIEIAAHGYEINGNIRDPDFTDPDGTDNSYGTTDDDYSLDSNSNEIGDGPILNECFSLDISNGDSWFETETGYSTESVCLSEALHPLTNWSKFPSPTSIITANQNDHGTGWERGAYVYDEGGGPGPSCGSYHTADNNPQDCHISLSELNAYLRGNPSIHDIIDAMGKWKAGSYT